MANAVAVVVVVASAAAAVVAVAGDVDVDWTAAAADGMNVIDSYPEVAFHQAVGTFPETTSSVPVVQCLVPYFPPRKPRRKCKSENSYRRQTAAGLYSRRLIRMDSSRRTDRTVRENATFWSV